MNKLTNSFWGIALNLETELMDHISDIQSKTYINQPQFKFG